MFKLSHLAKVLMISVCFITLGGCATMFGNKNRDVAVNSTPPGAKVYYNGNYVGHTPTHVTVGNPLDTDMIRVAKKHYIPQEKPVKTSFQGVGALNILFWPGFIVDFATGDMKKVSPHLNFVLAHA